MEVVKYEVSLIKNLLTTMMNDGHIIVLLNLVLNLVSSYSLNARFMIGLFSFVIFMFLLNRKRNSIISSIKYNEKQMIFELEIVHLTNRETVQVPLSDFECRIVERRISRFNSQSAIAIYRDNLHLGDIRDYYFKEINEVYNRLLFIKSIQP